MGAAKLRGVQLQGGPLTPFRGALPPSSGGFAP